MGMSSDYEISQDGTIFHIKEDGTISKLGKIENGQIVKPESETSSSDDSPSWKGILIFFLVGFAIATIVLGVLLHQANEDYYSAQYYHRQEVKELNDKISNVTQERDLAIKEFSDFKNNLGKSIPFYITDVAIGNTYYDGTIETQYGARINSSTTMYLTPRISYMGVISGNRKLFVKLFYPDGSLSTGTSSPSGYSFSDTVYIGNGNGQQRIMGWGNREKGQWKAGNYRIEIWYNNACIFTKTFTIY